MTAADVERVYGDRMLSSRGHAELSQLEERLRRVLGKRRMVLAIDLLTEASVAGALTPAACARISADQEESLRSPGVLADVLGILEHDGHLTRSGDDLVFWSKLLEDWWRARFSAGYRLRVASASR